MTFNAILFSSNEYMLSCQSDDDELLKLPLILRIMTFMTFTCMTRNNRALGMGSALY